MAQVYGNVIQPQQAGITSEDGRQSMHDSMQQGEGGGGGDITAPLIQGPIKNQIPDSPGSEHQTEQSITEIIKKIVFVEDVPNFKKGFMDDDLFAPDDDQDISQWWDQYQKQTLQHLSSGSPVSQKKKSIGGTKRGSVSPSPQAKQTAQKVGMTGTQDQAFITGLTVNDADGFLSLVPEAMVDRMHRQISDKQRWKRHVETLRKAHQVEKLNMQIIAEARAKEKIKGEINKVQKAFDDEFAVLKEQYTDMRLSIIKKDKMIKKMADLVVKQEEMLTEYRLVIQEKRKKQGTGMFSHRNQQGSEQDDDKKGDSKKGKKQQPKTLKEITGLGKPPAPRASGANSTIINDPQLLLHQVQTANNLSQFYIRDYEVIKKKLLDLQKQMQQVLKKHQIFIQKLRQKFAEREQQLKKKIIQVRREFEIFKLDINRQVDVKQIIINRQIDYIQVLKRQLVLAKNIIKNPKLFDKATMKMNYKIIDLYPIGQKQFNRSQNAQCSKTAKPGRYPQTDQPGITGGGGTFVTSAGGHQRINSTLPKIQPQTKRPNTSARFIGVDRNSLSRGGVAGVTDGFTTLSPLSGTMHMDIQTPSHIRHSSTGIVKPGETGGGDKLPAVIESSNSKAVLNNTFTG